MKLISVIVPVYNEEANVEPLYDAVNQTLERIAALPLRLASIVGIVLSGVAAVTIAMYFVLWLAYEQSWPAGFATLAWLMLLSLAINVIFLGIIGEYLARIYSQVKPHPLTIVARVVDRAATAGRDTDHRAIRTIAGIALPSGDAPRPDQTKSSGDGL
jgi:polyisoprenyl-phosphate glycosyltransferase